MGGGERERERERERKKEVERKGAREEGEFTLGRGALGPGVGCA